MIIAGAFDCGHRIFRGLELAAVENKLKSLRYVTHFRIETFELGLGACELDVVFHIVLFGVFGLTVAV